MSSPTKAQILDGLRRAYRTLPSFDDLQSPNEQTMIWIGQTKICLREAGSSFGSTINTVQGNSIPPYQIIAHKQLKQILIDAITSLEYETGGYGFAVDQGNVFDYFNETRKILASAKSEIFLIDPYATADLVHDYFKAIDPGVAIRVLISNKQQALAMVPAAQKLTLQNKIAIDIRSTDQMHDRFWFIDGTEGYQSSASINDGAKKAPAVIMKISDTFDAVNGIYEDKWNDGKQQT